MNRLVFQVLAAAMSASGAASADTFVNVGGNGNHASAAYPTGSRDQLAAAQAGYGIVSAAGFSASGFSFPGVATASVSSNDGGSYYLGAASGLTPANEQNSYFDSGDANDYIGSGTYEHPANASLPVLAFGNGTYTSNSLTLSFGPGVRAFGFNWDDVGDVGSTLRVQWSNNTVEFMNLGIDTLGNAGQFGNPAHDGFFGVIQRGGNTLTSITFIQNSGQNNDGFSLYGFQTSVVPLPPAAYAGFAGLGVAYVANRRRKSKLI